VRLYYLDQLRGSIPFLVQTTPAAVPMGYLGMTNEQLWNAYGVAFGGESIDPTGASVSPEFHGLFRPIL
jgi:hypothetical protein